MPVDKDFERQLLDSFYVHMPLKADISKTVESRALDKKLLCSVKLWDGESLGNWSFDGEGEASLSNDGGLCLKTWPRADQWPESEMRADEAVAGKYATFGSYVAKLDVGKLNLSRYNRIRFELFSDCPGLHSPIVRVAFVNDGKIKIPDAYSREGFHAMNLENHKWNTMMWEIDSLAHDKVTEISFTIHRYGKEISSGNELRFEIKNIFFEEVEQPEIVRGWQCKNETAVFSTSGYFARGKKTAIANTDEKSFEIIDADTGKTAFRGGIKTFEGIHGSFELLDFTQLEVDGVYRIKFGGFESETFCIADDILENAIWRLVNFLYCERCGYPVPGKHGACHIDVLAEHNGVKMTYAGGWHDAADVSQQTVQSAEILHALLECAASIKPKNGLLYKRMLEEANWGLDYILRTRFGDGYRATNSGIRRWTDNLIGNMDDCEANVHNHSFENFICAGVEAYASIQLAESDAELAWKCADTAREDFDFAIERFKRIGLEEIVMHEHSSSASLSQYYAAACFAAAQLYLATKDESYTAFVEEFAAKILACQETGEAKAPMTGFFYRDESKKRIVHFSHQARDQIFVQALAEACKALPQHIDKPNWENGMKLFGDYLKALAKYTEPYGMLPAGIYSINELEDAETFARIHPSVVFERENSNYKQQLENGTELGGGYYIKSFPVWFSYRGNSAIHLSMGKAAALLGEYFRDDALKQIACEQLYWTLGKNPMGQSLIYGEGSNYGQQYTALLGETVGEMPVGIQTLANEDLPYWPPANIATYREVWTTPPCRWLWIAANLV